MKQMLLLFFLGVLGLAIAQQRGQKDDSPGQAPQRRQQQTRQQETERVEAKAREQAQTRVQEAQTQRQAADERPNDADEDQETIDSQRRKGRPAATQAKGPVDRERGLAQQRQAIERQVVRQEQLHLQRQARLERLLELAEQNADERAVERVGKLMEREHDRYQRHLTRLRQRASDIDTPAVEEDAQE